MSTTVFSQSRTKPPSLADPGLALLLLLLFASRLQGLLPNYLIMTLRFKLRSTDIYTVRVQCDGSQLSDLLTTKACLPQLCLRGVKNPTQMTISTQRKLTALILIFHHLSVRLSNSYNCKDGGGDCRPQHQMIILICGSNKSCSAIKIVYITRSN